MHTHKHTRLSIIFTLLTHSLMHLQLISFWPYYIHFSCSKKGGEGFQQKQQVVFSFQTAKDQIAHSEVCCFNLLRSFLGVKLRLTEKSFPQALRKLSRKNTSTWWKCINLICCGWNTLQMISRKFFWISSSVKSKYNPLHLQQNTYSSSRRGKNHDTSFVIDKRTLHCCFASCFICAESELQCADLTHSSFHWLHRSLLLTLFLLSPLLMTIPVW